MNMKRALLQSALIAALGGFLFGFDTAVISGGHIFTFHAICMIGQLIWVLIKMPETKGISLEDLQKRLIMKKKRDPFQKI